MAKWNPFSKKSTSEPGSDAAAKADAAAKEDQATSEPSSSGGIFGRFRPALKKTVNVLNTDIRDLVGKDGRSVDEEFLTELFALLIKTDMGVNRQARSATELPRSFAGEKCLWISWSIP